MQFPPPAAFLAPAFAGSGESPMKTSLGGTGFNRHVPGNRGWVVGENTWQEREVSGAPEESPGKNVDRLMTEAGPI
jgi:hypothetical protein